MTMLRRRLGRPGLVGTVARTAVVAGTATAVSGRVQRRSEQRAADQQAEYDQQQQPPVDQAPDPGDEKINKIRELGKLHADGLLTDDEFTSAKASILGI
jgi:hypothetical protein